MDICRVFLLSAVVLLASDGAFAAGSVYGVLLGYDSGTLSLRDIHLTEGFEDAGTDNGPFECRLVSADETVVGRLRFDIPNKRCYDDIDPITGGLRGGCRTLDKTEFMLFIAQQSDAMKMEVYDENNVLVLSADLPEYSENAQEVASKKGGQGARPEKGADSTPVQENTIPGAAQKSADVSYIYLALFLVAAAVVGFIAYLRLKR
jgi:hypothetical protein